MDTQQARLSKTNRGISADAEPVRLWSKRTVAFDIGFMPDGTLVVLLIGGICMLDDTGRRVDHYLLRTVKTHNGGFFTSMSISRKTPHKMVLVETRGRLGMQCAHVYTDDAGVWRYDRYDICEWPRLVRLTTCGGFVVYSEKLKVFKYDDKGEQQWSVDVPYPVMAAHVDDADKIFLCFCGYISVYDANGSVLQQVRNERRIYSLCGSASGQTLAAYLLKWEESSRFEHRYSCILMYNSLSESPVRLMYIYGYAKPDKITVYKNHRLAIWGEHQLTVYKLTLAIVRNPGSV